MVVKCPKSGVNFFNLGDYEEQFEAARQRALPVLRQLLEEDRLAAGKADSSSEVVAASDSGKSGSKSGSKGSSKGSSQGSSSKGAGPRRKGR